MSERGHAGGANVVGAGVRAAVNNESASGRGQKGGSVTHSPSKRANTREDQRILRPTTGQGKSGSDAVVVKCPDKGFGGFSGETGGFKQRNRTGTLSRAQGTTHNREVVPQRWDRGAKEQPQMPRGKRQRDWCGFRRFQRLQGAAWLGRKV